MHDPEALFSSSWKELRTELTSWEAVGEPLRGYDGYTRYWCKDAVLGVFWIAEKYGDEDIELMLTTDIDLEGFRGSLTFPVDDELKRRLAEHVGWYDSAANIIKKMTDKQLSLFEGV